MYGKSIDGAEIVNPGLFRHQITWQSKTGSTQDSYGQDVTVWSDVITCRAQIQATGGREMTAVMQRWADAEYLLTQYYTPRLEPKMRIKWLLDGAYIYLDVLGIDDPPGTGRYQKVACKTFEGGFTA